ncbi:MAG: ankyrin repeat domain-containing protein [Thermoguttaceae bacterium]|nr:ankyrin repeat domain-containing protein [Thermoguttaceae bacterium]
MKKWSQILLILCMLLGGLCVNGFAANSQKKSEFEPVLYRASQHGNLKKVQNLIKHGADVNEETEEGETPLHAAAEEGHLDIIRFLIENGANVNAVDHNGNTPLHSALDKNKTDDEDEEEIDRVKEIVPFHGDFSFPTKGWPCSSCREYSRSNQLHQRFVRKIPKNSQRIGGFQPIRGEW